MDKNLISVNIIAYNNGHLLGKAFESIYAQKDVSFEIVFVNDASTDNTLAVAQSYKDAHPNVPFTIISNEQNEGINKSRNKAFHASSGAYIAVIDSDDVWTSDTKLKMQLDFLTAHPDHVLVGTQIRYVSKTGEFIGASRHRLSDFAIRNMMIFRNQFCHSSILMRKLMPYDESVYIWEDLDLILKLGLKGKLANLPLNAVDYLYFRKNNSLKQRIKFIETEFKIIKKYRKSYPHFWLMYAKRIGKHVLVLLNIK